MNRSIFAAVTLLCLMLAAPVGAAGPDDTDARAVEAAAALMKDGKADAALSALAAPLASYEARYRDERRTVFCAGTPTETLLYMGMAASAKQAAIAITPGWCDALFLNAFALIDLGRVADGLPFLERAVRMAPYNPHYLNELGFAYQALKDWPKSIDTYQRAYAAAEFASDRSKTAERTRSLRGKGFCLVEQGQWDEAEAAYRAALEIDPNDQKSRGELRYIAENRPKTS